MVITPVFQEFNTSGTLSNVATNLNLGSTNQADLNPQLYPIVAGTNSYEKWIKVQFNGTFTTISDVKLYKSDGAYVTGERLKFDGEQTSWTTPTTTTSTVATDDIDVSEPTSANVSIGGSLSGSITVEGDTTDFIVLQSQYTPNTSAGIVNEKTLILYYEDN